MQATLAPPLAPLSTRRVPHGLRLFYAGSVAVLALLAAATAASPLVLPALRAPQAAPLADAARLQVAAQPDEWVLQYNLLNDSSDAAPYRFQLAAAGQSLYESDVVVPAGRPYIFIYHLRPEQSPSGTVQFTVRRGGAPSPLEDVSLHLAALAPGTSAASRER